MTDGVARGALFAGLRFVIWASFAGLPIISGSQIAVIGNDFFDVHFVRTCRPWVAPDFERLARTAALAKAQAQLDDGAPFAQTATVAAGRRNDWDQSRPA
jgi:hypothetical protein